ncbi:hypothetical protein JCM17380_48950 [Desulfosporosinus burensis]
MKKFKGPLEWYNIWKFLSLGKKHTLSTDYVIICGYYVNSSKCYHKN